MRSKTLYVFLTMLLLLTVVSVSTPAFADECVIPTSGPWPPCATGGGNSQPANNPSPNSNECVIPTSGPWPPCATSGGASTNAPANTPAQPSAGQPCPASGAWPAGCVPGGSSPVPTSNNNASIVDPNWEPWEFAQYLRENRDTVAGHKFHFVEIKVYKDEYVQSASMDVGWNGGDDVIGIVSDVELRTYGELLLADAKAYFDTSESFSIGVVHQWHSDYWDWSDDCHYVGDYNARRGGWYVERQYVEVVYLASIGKYSWTICNY